jgi:type VI secretion system secreted protein VgrG
MPSPKSGSAGSAVAPADPTSAQDADVADPGEVEKIKATQLQTKSGKYGSTPVKPAKKPQTKEEMEKKKSWIAIKIVDKEDRPVTGEPYKIVLPDGTVTEGTTDDKGKARVEDIDSGNCKICLPKREPRAWAPK